MESLPLTLDNLNPMVKKSQFAVRGATVIRAGEIEKELAQGVKKPFKTVIKANTGDLHAVGTSQITFVRQVLAGCTYPPLLDQGLFLSDVVERCREILASITSVGCYSPSIGLPIVRKHIAEFIERRDGYPCHIDNIIVTNGASTSIKMLLQLFLSDSERTGIMIPIPQYPLYSATIEEFGMVQVPYYLDEDKDWELDISNLKEALYEARKTCNVRVLCVVNPGNPTGQLLSYENIKEIIQFAKDEGLFLMPDEVYQENIYQDGAQFHSFKKVLHDMGDIAQNFQMASHHSASKGCYGECGLRGGYVEVIGLEPSVLAELNKLQSAQLGANTIGQLAMDCIVNPPKPGDPSYRLFIEEKEAIINSHKERARLVSKTLNQIEGISCNEVTGAFYALPKIELPRRAVEAARALNQEPDFFYCMNLLEETGICVVPGSGFGQKEGTYHFRMTVLPSIEDLKDFLQKVKFFHSNFVKKYKD